MADFNKYTVTALRKELRSRELLTEGNKATLVARLQNSMLEQHQRNNQSNHAECLEMLVEQADSANEGNVNLVERGEEQPTENSIQQKLESMTRELLSMSREKKLLQQKLDFQKRKNESMQHELVEIKKSNVSLQHELDKSKQNNESLQQEP